MATYKKPADVKIGVIGYGGAFNMGQIHLNALKAAGAVPTAVCDMDKARLKTAEEEFPGIETYTSVATMLKKSEANFIVIITPHDTHAKLALQCLRAGRHVCCEKPLAITTAECDRMIAEAKKRKLVLTTYHNRHWDGIILEALKQIKTKGVIGDVVRIEVHMGAYGQPKDWWRSSKTISGGILYDWGVHLLEYALQLIDSDLVEVSAFAHKGFWAPKLKWKKDANEDDATAIVRFASGQMLSLNISQLDANSKQNERGTMEVTGTKGTYIGDQVGWKTIVPKAGGKVVTTTGKNTASDWNAIYQNVVDHLVKGSKLVITPEWSRRPIHILDLADQSIKKNKAIPAKYK